MTAQDETTTRTYTVTVNRAEFVCAAPDLSGRPEAWTGTVTVERVSSGVHGYFPDGLVGGLSGTMFDVGPNSYTIDGVAVDSGDGTLYFSLNRELASADSGHLRLHVCDAQFALGEARYSDNARHDYDWSGTGLDWSTAATVSLALSAASPDATLSALALADDEGGAVTLNEPFDPVGTAYTASVASSVRRITVTPAVSHANATVEYLDGDGAALADADTGTDGFQVDLEAGDNVIGVRVTAADGATTRTYTVTVLAAASTDATLSALALANDEGGAVALNEPFAADDTVYTASVANRVGQVTVTPAVNDANATVEYLDGAGAALADADTVTDGHQVSLEVGDTVFGVKVTAEDETTTRTYTVTVNRAEFACTAPDLSGLTEAWTGTVTVGSIADGVHGYFPDGLVGGLSGTMFDAVSNSYTIDGVAVDSGDGTLYFSLNRELAGADSGYLRLHVCDAQFALGDARYSGNARHDYDWSGTGLDWSTAATVELALSLDVSTDAALSALELADDEGGAVALNEPFAADDTVYTASVANRVGQVTVTPAVNDANATVDYLDVDGAALADADGVTDGFQVSLEAGDNVIGVRVTAQDVRTTRTYRLTVRRAEFVCTAPDLSGRPGVWSGTVTVGESPPAFTDTSRTMA